MMLVVAVGITYRGLTKRERDAYGDALYDIRFPGQIPDRLANA
jgi:hypothetical protein